MADEHRNERAIKYGELREWAKNLATRDLRDYSTVIEDELKERQHIDNLRSEYQSILAAGTIFGSQGRKELELRLDLIREVLAQRN